MSVTIKGAIIETPEHDKLLALNGENQVVGAFAEWLLGKYEIWEFSDNLDEFVPVNTSIQRLLGEYYGISNDEIEREKCAMLAALRGE